ncbi:MULTISPECIES: hypothetical protein [unclassified Enterococcus]|jgi:CHASE1-domain containing sensor protein|uniref:hypothetical protein n=1 Tax=unclassified Enterococcus TaxID=2608891 RepID=UPI003D2A0877
MKKKLPLILLLVILLSGILIWGVLPKMKQEKQNVIKTTIIDKNGKQLKPVPITEISGELGK